MSLLMLVRLMRSVEVDTGRMKFVRLKSNANNIACPKASLFLFYGG